MLFRGGHIAVFAQHGREQRVLTAKLGADPAERPPARQSYPHHLPPSPSSCESNISCYDIKSTGKQAAAPGTVGGCGVLTAKKGRAAVTSVIRVRRVYEDPEPGDGARILVDRLWPR